MKEVSENPSFIIMYCLFYHLIYFVLLLLIIV